MKNSPRLFLLAALMAAIPFAASAGPCTSLVAISSATPCYVALVVAQNRFRSYGDENPSVTVSSSYGGSGAATSTVFSFPGSFFPGRVADVFGSQSASVGTNGSFRGESQVTSASSDLKTNTLGISVSGTPYLSEPVDSLQDTMISVAYIRDQYTISFSKALSSALVSISMAIEGMFEESYFKGVGGVQGQFQAVSFAGHELAYMGRQYQTGEAVDDVLTDSFDLVGEVDMGDHWEATFDFTALLFNYGTAPGTTVDFGNTASLSLVLPEGVTFRRASDAELIAEVPEPGTLVLLGVGLLGLVSSRRINQTQGC